MPELKKDSLWQKLAFSKCWILYALVVIVLSLSILAFRSPVSYNPQNMQPTETADASLSDSALTQTPQSEIEPPTPEEIGYTDGIILWSTVLILILLVGTLREVVRRKDQSE